jgi:hypothetical protein
MGAGLAGAYAAGCVIFVCGGLGRNPHDWRPPRLSPNMWGLWALFERSGRSACAAGCHENATENLAAGWRWVTADLFTGELPMGPHAARRFSAKARGMRLILMAHFALVARKRSRHRVHSLVDKNYNRYRL